MELNVRDTILPLVEGEQEQLLRRFPEHADAIRLAVQEFRDVYGDRIFSNLPELTSFCSYVDDLPLVQELDASLRQPITESRRKILAQIAVKYVQSGAPRVVDIDPEGM